MRYIVAITCAAFGAFDIAQAACDPRVYGLVPGDALLRPVAASSEVRVTDRFGKMKHPLLGYMRLHGGVDFDGPIGTPVVAARGGQVLEARFKGEFGNTISIAHEGGVQTQYSNMSGFADRLSLGACVRRGDRIGYIGQTGLSDRPRLHFEVQIENTAIDPAPFLEKLED